MRLTPEQIEEMVNLSAPLVENPLPWSSLSEEQKGAFQMLMPNPSFDDTQRHYLGLWFLPVSMDDVEAITELMPSGREIEPIESADGRRWLRADLLSDALDGKQLSPILHILESLPLTYVHTIEWPQPE